jgi:uncharacterized membrane protein YdbT with pleckstrin-like domain
MADHSLVISKVWRSEFPRVLVFFVLLAGCTLASRAYPQTIIKGELIMIGATQVILSLPLLWLIPAWSLLSTIVRIYNVRYLIDSQGIESRTGILSLHQVITRIRYEDIRSIEIEQSVLARILDVGTVEMGTAATGAVEVALDGVAAPKQVQDLIQAERDRRQKAQNKGSAKSSQIDSTTTDFVTHSSQAMPTTEKEAV